MTNRAKAALIANVLLALVFSISPAIAGMFKVVQPDGRVIYTDRPPTSKQSGRVTEIMAPKAPDASTSATNPAQESSAGGRQEIAQPATLTMYSSAGCSYCVKAKAFLNSHGIPFREVDVDRDSVGRQEFIRLGGQGVPFFEKGGRTLSGYSPGGLQALVGRSN